MKLIRISIMGQMTGMKNIEISSALDMAGKLNSFLVENRIEREKEAKYSLEIYIVNGNGTRNPVYDEKFQKIVLNWSMLFNREKINWLWERIKTACERSQLLGKNIMPFDFDDDLFDS